MSSARRPDRVGSAVLGVPPAQRTDPVFDSMPGELLSPPPAPQTRPAHLVPCSECSALNGRSALLCWACEADLLAPGPAASAAPPRPAEPEPEPEPVAVAVPLVHEQTVVERAGAVDGRGGLHLVSRGGTPASIQPAAVPPAPEFFGELPVLTALVEESVPVPVPAPMLVPVLATMPSIEPLPAAPRVRPRYSVPMLALALAAVLLLLIAAGLRWWGAPAALQPVTSNAVPVGPAGERPFASPAQGSAPDELRLSFPPRQVEPTDVAASTAADSPARGPARAKPAATSARSVGKARETRPAVAKAVDALLPPAPQGRQRNTAPAPCTSNMAALGFCTLEPASAKE